MRTPELHPLDCKKLYEEYYLHQTGRGMAAFTGARYQEDMVLEICYVH